MASDLHRTGNEKYRYTVPDCACEVCLYYSRKNGCKRNVCCCAEERRQALEREAKKCRKGGRKRGDHAMGKQEVLRHIKCSFQVLSLLPVWRARQSRPSHEAPQR